MPFPLAYCPHGADILPRLRRLYVDRAPDLVLAAMHVPSLRSERLRWKQPAGFCDYPDPTERAEFWAARLRGRAAIHDDSIACAYPSEMDQGLYGGLIGGDVRFLSDPASGWVSSMVAPILRDLAEVDRLAFSIGHPWFRRYLRQLDAFNTVASGKFAISHFILINGLNFVFELVGATTSYLALTEQPERVRQAIELGYRVNLAVQNAFFDNTPLLEGGTCSANSSWVPGRIIAESVDPFHMARANCFEQWGREHLERTLAQFDGGVTHIHANGRHLLEAVSRVKGLKAIALGDDRGFPASFDVLPDVRRRVGDLPLIVGADFDPFRHALRSHSLVGGVFYLVGNVPSIGEANRCMDDVHSYKA